MKVIQILILCFGIFHISNAQSWFPLGSGMGGDLTYHPVRCLTIYNNDLIAGGDFITAGGVNANHIAKWNGTTWSPLGSGITGSHYGHHVYALIVYNNNLIVGGRDTIAGGLDAKYVAKWDGSSWSPLGSGMDNVVYTFAIYNNELIAGGEFDTIGGIRICRIAKWNGTTWLPLGSGMEGLYTPAVNALTVYNNELIAGGIFNSAGGVSVNNIAKWNGTSWSPLGSGIGGTNSYVKTLFVFNNELYAGGLFSSAGGVNANYIAKWNGTIWSPLGTEVNNTCIYISSFNNNLIAGGNFTYAGGITVNSIAKWNGVTWSALGVGMGGLTFSPEIYSIVTYNNCLIAGGLFLSAGSINVNYIAKWDPSVGIKRTDVNIPDKSELLQNYPNPFNPTTKIKFKVRNSNPVNLTVFDNLGKEIINLVNEVLQHGTYEITFDASSYPSGIYFYSLNSGKFKETKRMTLIK